MQAESTPFPINLLAGATLVVSCHTFWGENSIVYGSGPRRLDSRDSPRLKCVGYTWQAACCTRYVIKALGAAWHHAIN